MNIIRTTLILIFAALLTALLILRCNTQRHHEEPEEEEEEEEIERGEERAENLGGNGALKITLVWDNPKADLDLHVIEPSGNHLFFNNMCQEDGTQIQDVDWLPSEGNPRNIGENMVWTTPAMGTYRIEVSFYGYMDESSAPVPAVPAEIYVYRNRRQVEKHRIRLNAVTGDETQFVARYTVR